MNAAPSNRSGILCLVWLAGVVYAALCMQHWIARPVPDGLVFNEMLQNLLHGRFDINPATIGDEAFVYQGRSYAYFGIFCALLRLPLLVTGNNALDITGFSLLAAAAISLACRLAIVGAILNRARAANPVLRWAILIAVAANGESIQYLAPSIYQEVVSWGAALASIFVLVAARMVLGLTERSAGNYAILALVAGLALLCRVTFGLGLTCALAFMAIIDFLRSGGLGRQFLKQCGRLVPAAAILTLCILLATGVNYARWGNALSFVPLQYQTIMARIFPDRPQRLARYGAMNIARVPFSLQYYFAPVWALTNDRGELLLEHQQVELFDGVEFPPGSLLLSDPVICILAALGLGALASRSRAPGDPALARAAVAGLAIPACLVLTVIGLTFRYRMDFYPLLDFAACIGLARLVWRDQPLPRYVSSMFAAFSLCAMAVALVSFLSYILIGFGPATMFNTSRGWIGLLEDKVAGKNVYRAHQTSASPHGN